MGESDTASYTPAFTAVIEPPAAAEAIDLTDDHPVTGSLKCCKETQTEDAYLEPLPAWAAPRDPMVDALPTILVGVAAAFAVGALVGFLISNPVSIE